MLDTVTMSSMFIYLNVAFFAGALSSGLLFDRLNEHLQTSLMTCAMGLALLCAPRTSELYQYQLLIAAQAFCQGYVYSAVPGQIFRLWCHSPLKAPLLNAVNALWSLGCFLAPIIALPFVVELPTECRAHATSGSSYAHDVTIDVSDNNSSQIAANAVWKSTNATSSESRYDVDVVTCDTDVTAVRHVFLVIGLMTLAASAVSAVVFVIDGPSLFHKNQVTPVSTDCPASGGQGRYRTKLFEYSLLAVAFTFFVFATFYLYLPFNYLASFAIQGLNWEVSRGPMLISTMTGMSGIGRVLAVPVSYFVPASVMLPLMLTVTSCSYVLMVVASMFYWDALLWLCVAASGLGSSGILSFLILWLGQHISVRSSTGALLLMASSVGGLTSTALVGRLFVLDHMWLVYVCLAACGVDVALYLLLVLIAKLCYRDDGGKRPQEETESGDVTEQQYLNTSSTPAIRHRETTLREDLQYISSQSSLS